MALVLTGRLVTFDPARPTIDRGALYLDDAGRIEAVASAADPAPAGFGSAARVATGGTVYPGLIDLHNHLAYNTRGLWFAPRGEPYDHHDAWTRAKTYRSEISIPNLALAAAAGKAVLKFAEVKAVVGGCTAIQGSPGLSRPYEGWLVRNVEHETFGTGDDVIVQSALTRNREQLAAYTTKMEGGASFIYHLAEGTAASLRREWDDVVAARALHERLVAVHATVLTRADFRAWRRAGAGTVVWSPFSNLWLYRATTDVVRARESGQLVCLGSDWGPSGTKNILGELKVGALWNRDALDGAFTDRELCEMVTANPGDALARAWGPRVGRLREGLAGDVAVVADRVADPYANLIRSTERHVRLVLVQGRPVYGSGAMMAAAGSRTHEPITVAGVRRAIQLVDPGRPDADMSWPDVLAALERVRADPGGRLDAMALPAPPGEEPLQLIPDMPLGGAPDEGMLSDTDLREAVIPPIDSIYHDAAFFRSLAASRAPILGGRLDRLREFFRG